MNSRSGSIAGDQRVEAKSSFAWRSKRCAVDLVTHHRIVHPPSGKTTAKPQGIGAT
jgi:hypothetical protein